MRATLSRAAAALACTFMLVPSASRAADWIGSYAADGRCYCSGALPASLASRIVPTPLGGQSVAKVCARLGDGPGLGLVDGRFDRVVYRDAQCGHGPYAAADTPAPPDCAGTLEPGGDDCRARGPRWDLTGAYARGAAAAVATSLGGVGVMGAPLVTPVLAAAGPGAASGSASGSASGGDARIVVIDGRRWRQAPRGTPEAGPPGSRVIVDGRVFLDADTTPESVFAPRASLRPKRVVKRRPVRRAVAPPAAKRDDSPEAIRLRQKVLLAEARARLRKREATPSLVPAPVRRPAALAERPVPDAGSVAGTNLPESSTGLAPGTSAPADTPARTPTRLLVPLAMSRRGRGDVGAGTVEAAVDAPSDARDGTRVDTTAGTTTGTTTGTTAGTRIPVPSVTSRRDRGESMAETGVAGDVPATPDRSAASEAARREALDETTEALAADDGEPPVSSFSQALRLPPSARPSSREFGYVDAMPLSYDYGGGGVMLEGSVPVRERYRLLARLGASADYQELLLGGSWHMTPPAADRLTLVLTAGVETGRFELQAQDVSAELSDSGFYLGGSSRLVVSRRFELQAGLGYSSFFEGDPVAFGGGFFHATPRLDIVSRFELGDNDSLGIGVRYYY